MKLTHLVRNIPFEYKPFTGDAEITSVVSDSRLVQPGSLFVALIGETEDGHQYIPSAIEQGASAVVGTKTLPEIVVPYLQVSNSRIALPHLAAAFYGYPAQKLTMIGVTGTDGKTTTTNMIYQILLAEGIKCGMISTINAVIGDQVLDTGFHVTTPDAPDIQRHLAEMVSKGITHVVLEVTSHGLAQHRVDACEFDVAVITNITHEHLDYHGTYEVYRSTKAQLFANLDATLSKSHGNFRIAILNRDDPSYEYLRQVSTGSVISYGMHPDAEVHADGIQHQVDGLSFEVHGRGLSFQCVCPLPGIFNISNSLAAIGATVYALNVNPEAAQTGLLGLKNVPGRMERIDLGQNFTAIVDFAHTPNALRVALQTARQITHGRVIAVFGSAGLRDRQKRRMMAETSIELADITILTAEDPRTESLEDILAEMATGASSRGGIEGQTFWRIPDRGDAIRFAVNLACEEDLVISCGKGHEQSMCFGNVEYPWDDRTAMRAALSEQLGIPGPQMPYLPSQVQ